MTNLPSGAVAPADAALRLAAIEDAIAGRRSVRAFRPDPVARETLERILEISARAPSGTNMQPWRTYVLAGRPLRSLTAALAADHGTVRERKAEYDYYPSQFFEPYLGRRRKVGFDLYGILGIARGDTERMHHQHGKNLGFFGAPVGLLFTISRRLEIGSWLDYGMFLENIMIAARAHGLETCVQAAFAPYHDTIRAHVDITPDEVVVCGMSVGYEDRAAPENGLITERSPTADFASFVGWDADAAA